MKDTKKTLQRLQRIIVFAAIRGAATAAGSSLIGLAIWWITGK